MTRQMSAGSQIAFTRSWLERQNIESQTIDVEAHIDPSLSYEENIKLFKRRFNLGGGRSEQKATKTMSAAECDVAIGNYHAGYNHGSMKDACECGHPDACVDLERKQRTAAPKRKAAKPKKTAAKPAKPKAKKPAPELTAAQRKRLNATGRITVKRGGKFVTITR